MRLLVANGVGAAEDPRIMTSPMSSMFAAPHIMMTNQAVANPVLHGGVVGIAGQANPQVAHFAGAIANPLAGALGGMANVMYQHHIKPE